jgi:hypothetical protein
MQTKSLRVFLLAIQSPQSFALRFPFLQTHATSYGFYSTDQLLYTIKKNGGKPERKPNPFSLV